MIAQFNDSSSLASLSIPHPPTPPTFTQSDLDLTTFSLSRKSSLDVTQSSSSNAAAVIKFSLDPVDFSLNNVDGISIKNCPNIQNALEMLEQHWFIDKFSQQFSVFLIKFEVMEESSPKNHEKIEKIFKSFNKKFSIILFEFPAFCEIFWKFGKDKIFSINLELKIVNFFLKFLTHSMKFDGHSGISLDTLSILGSLDEICQLDLHALADQRDFNLLMLATELGDENAVNFFLHKGVDVNYLVVNKTAVDLAWENRHFGIVLLLLNANSVFPSKFNVKEATDELKTFANLARQFHNFIKDQNVAEIVEILDKNPNLRHFYTTKNMSAATKAAMCGHFEIYDLLMSYNVFIGPKEDVNAILKKLDENHRENMRGINLKYIQNWTDKHLMILAANSFVGHDVPGVDEKLEHVTKAFEFLNLSHPFVSLILKVVAASREFKIIFDFNRDSVQYLDPTADRHTRGIYHTSRHIYVAAQHLFDKDRKFEAYGTLIHELCHYAVHLVYHNQCRPYYSKDDENTVQRFSAIAFMCQIRAQKEVLIDMVFKNYLQNFQHAELIVRVPHIIVQYSENHEKLNENQRTFPELFSFFEKVTAIDMKNSLPNIEIEAEEEIQKFAYRTKKQKRQILNLWILSTFLLLSLPFLILLTWWLVFVPVEPVYSCGNLTDELRMKILNSTVDFQGENVIFEDLFGRNLTSCDGLTTDEIGNMLKVFDAEKFLNKDQDKVENPQKEVILSDFETVETEIYQKYKAKNFRVPGLKIGQKVTQKSQIYINRKISYAFEHHMRYSYYPREFDDLKKDKLLLLSDGPGSGKSTTFRRIALKFKQMYPLHWVSYVDLKLYFQEFKELSGYSKPELTLELNATKVFDFLAQKIFNLTSKVELEVFNQKFRSNQSIFLWDGLDEISPYSLVESLSLFQFINRNTKNIQWISTRPSFKQNVMDKFHVSEHKLALYDEQNRQEFIIKFLESENFSIDEITAARQKIEVFIKRLEKQGTYDFYEKEMVNSPLMLDMICKSYSKSQTLDNSTNLYTFFEFYINQLFDIVQQEKKEVVLNDTRRIERQEMFRAIHQHFAMKDILDGSFIISDIFDFDPIDTKNLGILKLKMKWTDNEISRYGILFPDPSGKLNFDHRTFKEFFIAQYFHDNIWNLKYGQVSQNEARLRLLILFAFARDGEKVYKVILDFVAGFVDAHAGDTDETFNEEVSYLMQYEFKDLLSSQLRDARKIEYFTKFFKKDQKILEILWKIEKNRSFFHQFIGIFTNVYQMNDIADVVKRNFEHDDKKKILEGKFQKINFLYILWIKKNDEKFVRSFINHTNFFDEFQPYQSSLNAIKTTKDFINFIASKNFSQAENFEFISAFSFEITMNSKLLSEFKCFWELAERELSSTEMKAVLQQKQFEFNQTLIFQLDKMDENITKFFLNLIEKHLNKEEIVKLLMQRDRHDKHSVLTYTAFILKYPKSFEHIWAFMKKYLNQEKRKVLLTSKKDIQTLDMVCRGTRLESFYFYKKVFKETFSAAEIQKMMKILDKNGETLIFHTVTSLSRGTDFSSEVAKFIEEIFVGNDDGIRELLSVKSKERDENIFKKFDNDKWGWKAKREPFEKLARKVFNEEQLKLLYV